MLYRGKRVVQESMLMVESVQVEILKFFRPPRPFLFVTHETGSAKEEIEKLCFDSNITILQCLDKNRV